ncbi:DUF3006 domain-containing protein [Heyndrickxia sporothermodurans]|uniref:DUF3006 domain-containing protein n=1 Tax=Heyndrickxia sporothermodurans TaxID=46224 RepID=A0A150LAS3_9BACI|nr:DUF3006 domain-containing protein [Heyndrickxia sporothermodurans]KYD09109.1 hypothetical protein B4102_2636 [Heyndrickxia sporothermodurans]MBL5768278.1 DUF3006 domain-containing protein [Heyndrickxia sporothermodurans]MBL5771902.1 DUF3006 domain-containing protein [Heyndrickxia sporothermodurans]MBL5775522.1 DUF3006 domain-containing protein [Heyndrickxia sporothermodurans]MBL5778977.1 DUF3006 domain-containing protein [Heyndrickxia sporothermodurans]
MKYIIDRFEGEIAVCETEEGKMIEIDKRSIPAKAKIGDVLILVKGQLEIDQKSTQQRRKEIKKLMNEVWDD